MFDLIELFGYCVLLECYVDAFEWYDIEMLVGLLRDDVVLSMLLYDMWLWGLFDLVVWFFG